MLILHGENTVQSRNHLFATISAAKSANRNVLQIDAKTLDLATLEQALGSESLFAEEKMIIISELHSLPKSKKKDELIEMIANSSTPGNESESTEVILWEKRDLTPTMLKKFPAARSEQFKLSSALFNWLDNISGQKESQQIKKMIDMLRKAVSSDGDFMCFSMLVRQIRLLIQVKDGNVAGIPPFMIGKLKKQSSTFSAEQLLTIHHRLLLIDVTQKNSQTRFKLSQELELLLATL
jgi:DNA polymerase III delta subunit